VFLKLQLVISETESHQSRLDPLPHAQTIPALQRWQWQLGLVPPFIGAHRQSGFTVRQLEFLMGSAANPTEIKLRELTTLFHPLALEDCYLEHPDWIAFCMKRDSL
jgi:hypothetical protein